jgi:molecular chaperone HscB
MKKGGVAVGNPSMSERNPFQILGMEPTFEIEKSSLDQAYFGRQATVHPDRFVLRSSIERQAALDESCLLNQAYEIVKDPVLRAKALLKLRGISGEESPEPALIAQMIELQEALQDADQDLEGIKAHVQEQFEAAMASFGKAIQGSDEQEQIRLFLQMTYFSKMRGDIKTLSIVR